MLLKTAKRLSKLVQSQHAITWRDIKEVESYIERLQTVVNTLAAENHKLISYHQIISTVVSLSHKQLTSELFFIYEINSKGS